MTHIGVARGVVDAPAPPRGGEINFRRKLQRKFVSAHPKQSKSQIFNDSLCWAEEIWRVGVV